jgi:hypothetical protein
VALKSIALGLAAAACAALGGCAELNLPADSIDAVRAPPAVDISFEQDAAHRLLVRYQAPAAVTHLDFLLHDERIDRVFRTPSMKPANDCGTLVPGGLALRHGAGCERGALFVVEPRAMGLDALYEPAQPSSDGGVLFYTGYYALAAPHLATRWRFTPSAGDYVIDDSRRHDASWQVAPGLVFDGAKAQGDQRDADDWLIAQHAQQYVFLGHTPMTQTGGLLWVHDPALPQVIVDTVGRAGPIAWDAYARAAGRAPDGQTAIVMLSASGGGHLGYHGDRTEGHMLRLSFAQAAAAPDARQLEQWSTFVAHETAHLWNHGVFESDQDRPWLHEGDAEWIALVAMHDAHLVADRTLVDELQSRVDACLLVRGDAAAASLPKGRRQDDPYGCGVALQLLGQARRHADPVTASMSPLAAWGALHRAHPRLDTAGFASFFDAAGSTAMHQLLLDPHVAFAPAYRADLAAVMPLREVAGEPAAQASRLQLAFNLMRIVDQADCGALGFSLDAARGVFVLDTGMQCKALPNGAHLSTIAGIDVVPRPRAAWQALRQACAVGHQFDVGFEFGFDNRAAVKLECPALLPGLPAQVVLPDDVLARLGLSTRPVAAASP